MATWFSEPGCVLGGGRCRTAGVCGWRWVALHLVGPSGGYLLCFPLAAALVGYLVEKGVARSSWKLVGGLVSADVLMLLAGSTWLHLLFRVPYAQGWLLGFYPFLIADVGKIVLVGCALPRVLRHGLRSIAGSELSVIIAGTVA